MTRGYLSNEDNTMTDLWVFDYVNGQLVQSVHQSSTDEGWGTPKMSLSYGKHHVYFIASRGTNPVVNESSHMISWDVTSDTFWTDYEVDVVSTSNGNRAVSLDRVATRLKVVLNDELPVGIATIVVTPEKWYYGIDYTNGTPMNEKQNTDRTVNVPASYIGTSGLSVSIYGISGSDEWKTGFKVTAKDADGNVMGQAEVKDAPFKRNRVTEYSGNLFSSSGGMTIWLNEDWDDSHTGQW